MINPKRKKLFFSNRKKQLILKILGKSLLLYFLSLSLFISLQPEEKKVQTKKVEIPKKLESPIRATITKPSSPVRTQKSSKTPFHHNVRDIYFLF